MGIPRIKYSLNIPASLGQPPLAPIPEETISKAESLGQVQLGQVQEVPFAAIKQTIDDLTTYISCNENSQKVVADFLMAVRAGYRSTGGSEDEIVDNLRQKTLGLRSLSNQDIYCVLTAGHDMAVRNHALTGVITFLDTCNNNINKEEISSEIVSSKRKNDHSNIESFSSKAFDVLSRGACALIPMAMMGSAIYAATYGQPNQVLLRINAAPSVIAAGVKYIGAGVGSMAVAAAAGAKITMRAVDNLVEVGDTLVEVGDTLAEVFDILVKVGDSLREAWGVLNK
jgi:hypothetical protein